MESSISIEDCDNCINKSETEESCEAEMIIKGNPSHCCSNKTISTTLKDNFNISKGNNQNLNSVKFLPYVILSEELFSDIDNSPFIDRDSPPTSLQSNELYILNSILLI